MQQTSGHVECSYIRFLILGSGNQNKTNVNYICCEIVLKVYFADSQVLHSVWPHIFNIFGVFTFFVLSVAEMWHTDCSQGGCADIWAGRTRDCFQPVFIIVLGQSTPHLIPQGTQQQMSDIQIHSFFIRTSYFGAEAERSYFFAI